MRWHKGLCSLPLYPASVYSRPDLSLPDHRVRLAGADIHEALGKGISRWHECPLSGRTSEEGIIEFFSYAMHTESFLNERHWFFHPLQFLHLRTHGEQLV